MKITLQIDFADKTTRSIVVSAADMVAFENKFDLSIAALQEPRMSWLLFLAWHSEKRRKATEDEYEKWLDSVEAVGASEDPKA